MRPSKRARATQLLAALFLSTLMIGCTDQATSVSHAWEVECDDQASLDAALFRIRSIPIDLFEDDRYHPTSVSRLVQRHGGVDVTTTRLTYDGEAEDGTEISVQLEMRDAVLSDAPEIALLMTSNMTMTMEDLIPEGWASLTKRIDNLAHCSTQ